MDALPTPVPAPSDEDLVIPWLQMDGEPQDAYNLFSKYYLALGPSRTLLKAYMTWLKMEHPDKAEKYALTPKNSATIEWSHYARAWSWRARAQIFDEVTFRNAQHVVAEARTELLSHAADAARALVAKLIDPRLGVAAAKEILDRVGLPAASIVGVANLTPFTSDDLAEARREVAAWEAQFKVTPLNDSSG